MKSFLGNMLEGHKQPNDDFETVSAALERVVEAQQRTNELLGELVDLFRPPVTPKAPSDDGPFRVMSRADREAELAVLAELLGPEEDAPKRPRRRRGTD